MSRTAIIPAALLLSLLLLPARAPAQAAATQNRAAAEAKTEDAAPAPVRVTGVLRTAKRIPVPGAPVRLVHLPTGKAWTITTDENGNFSVPDLPPGRYRIEARHLGLGSISQEVDLASDSAAPIELTLRAAAAAPRVEAAPVGEKTEKAAETSAQPEPAKPAAESPENSSKPEGTKHSHHHKQAAESAETIAPKAGTPQVQEKPQTSQKTVADKAQAETANANSRKKHKAGFQQVEVTGQSAATTDSTQAAGIIPASADTAPLGEASSSDSYLLNGGVARTSTSNAAVSFAGVNPNGPGQGAPGESFGEDDSSGRGQGKLSHKGKGKGKAAQDDNLGAGLDALSARQQLRYLRSNRVHVNLYDFYGNSVGDAKAFSLTDPNSRKLGYYRERFGGKVGGPLVIPHVYDGKDRTFFYANYELQRRRLPFNSTDTVPTAEERVGNFTARGVQLYNPFSNVNGPRAFWGSMIPGQFLDQTAVALMDKLIPLPNLPGLRNNLHVQGTQAQALDRVDGLVLHTLSPRFSLQVAYNLVAARAQVSNVLSALGDDVSTRNQNATVGLTQNWTPRLLNETRLNFNRSRIETMNRFAFHEDVAGELGITGVSRAPIDWGAPTSEFTNYVTILQDGTPAKRRNQTFRLMDSLSYSLSRHTLRVGGEIRWRQKNDFVNPTPRGQFTFSGLMTSQLDAQGQPVNNTGWDLADFLIGLPETTALEFGSESIYLSNWWLVGYFQDDWRIHPRFSINWGVRYDLTTPYVEKYNRISNLDLNQNITALSVVTPGQVAPFSGSLPRSLLRADTHNLAPRLGIAWRPLSRGGPVVRAGYGIFYNGSIYDQIYLSMVRQPPFAQTATRVTSATQLLTLRNGFPPQPPDAVPNIVAVDPNYKVGYAQIWNLMVETPIFSNLLMEVTYTGTKGTHLDLLRAPNQARPGPAIGADQRRRIPGAQDFTYETSGANSIYNGLQVRLQRQMTHGLRLLFLYTYSKSIDDASAIGLVGPGNRTGIVQDDTNPAAERGLSSFDQRHQFRAWYRYELPFGERRQWLRSGWASAVFGNWTLSGNTTIQTGTHFTAFLNTARVAGIGSFFSQRPDQIGDPNNVPDGQRTPFHLFNTAAFALPPQNRFGNAGRNTIVGPGLTVVNASLGRRMHFGKDDRYRMDFRWEVANLFNHVNFFAVDSVFGSQTFGQVLGGGKNMRTMDLVMRVYF